MRRFSSALLLLALDEDVIFLCLIWNQPAAAWHSFFVVSMLLTAAGLLYSWAVEGALVRMTRIGRVALSLLTLSTSAGIVFLLGMIALFH